MGTTPFYRFAIAGALAGVIFTGPHPRAQGTSGPELRTFIVRGDIVGGGGKSHYFGSFEIAAEPPTRFVQSELRSYVGNDAKDADQVATAMGWDGARTIFQPTIPEYQLHQPNLVPATPAQEKAIRTLAEDALRSIQKALADNGARAPFTITRGNETWKVRDVKTNVDLPEKLFRK